MKNYICTLLLLITPYFISQILLGNTNEGSPSLNYLIRSGELSEIENTPIYTNEGINFSIGGVHHEVFDVTARLHNALSKLDHGDNPAVETNWTTTAEYEEWSDRLILRKTTNFYVLDGLRFAQNFNGSDSGFTTDENLFPTNPVSLPNINELVQEFIDSGQHLDLYEEAKIAGNQGVEHLITELKQDRGPIKIIETVEFSRLVKILEDPANPNQIDILSIEPLDGKEITFNNPASIKNTRPNTFEASVNFSDDSGGIVSYSQKMLNGFTVGNEWAKGVTYDRTWFYVHASAFAGFGLGLRIPWTADVEVSKRQIPKEAPDKTEYNASIKVQTLDADEDFYRSVGVPTHHRYRGREMPLEAGAGIALKVKVLGVWAINNGRYDPIVGKVIDMSQDFDPPLGPVPMNLHTIDFPFETSGLAYNAEFAAVGGDFKAEIGVRGDSIDLRVCPYNSWNKNNSNYTKSYRNISLINENTPITLPFAIDDSSSLNGIDYYNFGPIYDQASYNTSLTIIPKARIRGSIYLSNLWDPLSDINISSNWHTLFTAAFSLPSLGPHNGIESKLNAVNKSKRLLPVSMSTLPIRFSSNYGLGVWDFTISELGSDTINIIEYIPEGYNVITESISDSGIFNEVERAITWVLAKGTIPKSISYRCVAVDSETSLVPNPIGSFEYYISTPNETNFQTFSSAIRDLRHQTPKQGELELNQYILSKRPTKEAYDAIIAENNTKLSLDEIKDLRSGSTTIEIENGKATLSFELEKSDDLNLWTNGGISNMEIPIDAEEGIKFYRFKMTE